MSLPRPSINEWAEDLVPALLAPGFKWCQQGNKEVLWEAWWLHYGPITFPRAAKHVSDTQEAKQCHIPPNPFTEIKRQRPEKHTNCKRQLIKSLCILDTVSAPVTEPFNCSVWRSVKNHWSCFSISLMESFGHHLLYLFLRKDGVCVPLLSFGPTPHTVISSPFCFLIK